MLPGMNAAMMVAGGEEFPVVEGAVTSTDTSGPEATVTLPSGIVSGELLVVMLSIRSGGNITNWDSTENFTELFQEIEDFDVTLAVAYRIADGGEPATVDFARAGGPDSAHVAYRISGASSIAPYFATAQGSSTNPNPPNLIPAGGSHKYLWLAVAASKEDATSGDPDNYTNGLGIGETNEKIRSAQRELGAASDDPTTFTMSTNEWACATIAIKPR